jgi:hypothetical protein
MLHSGSWCLYLPIISIIDEYVIIWKSPNQPWFPNLSNKFWHCSSPKVYFFGWSLYRACWCRSILRLNKFWSSERVRFGEDVSPLFREGVFENGGIPRKRHILVGKMIEHYWIRRYMRETLSGVSTNEATPIAGKFLSWKIRKKWWFTGWWFGTFFIFPFSWE